MEEFETFETFGTYDLGYLISPNDNKFKKVLLIEKKDNKLIQWNFSQMTDFTTYLKDAMGSAMGIPVKYFNESSFEMTEPDEMKKTNRQCI